MVQASLLIKFVTGPKLEIGLRHANIPQEKIANWDRWLASAISKRAGLQHANLHYYSVICNITPIETLHIISKTIHTLSSLVKPSELQTQYQDVLTPIIKTSNDLYYAEREDTINNKKQSTAKSWPTIETHEGMKTMLFNLSRLGLLIHPNPLSKCFAKEKVKNTDSRSHQLKESSTK